MLSTVHLTCPPGHTIRSRGRAPAHRSGSLGAAGIRPRVSSAAGIGTKQSCSVVQTVHNKLPQIWLRRIGGPHIRVEQCKNENMVIRVILKCGLTYWKRELGQKHSEPKWLFFFLNNFVATTHEWHLCTEERDGRDISQRVCRASTMLWVMMKRCSSCWSRMRSDLMAEFCWMETTEYSSTSPLGPKNTWGGGDTHAQTRLELWINI